MLILDMDGVLVDFCRAAYETHGKPFHDGVPDKFDFFEDWGLSPEQFWGPIDSCGYSWWKNIPEYSWTRDIISEAEKFHSGFTVATACSKHAHSSGGKVEAIQKLFGMDFRDYVITPRKWLLASPSRVLLDDNDDNCMKFEEHGGTAILFPQPWNRNRYIAKAGCRIEFVLEQLKRSSEKSYATF